jgi:hypothetical protein
VSVVRFRPRPPSTVKKAHYQNGSGLLADVHWLDDNGCHHARRDLADPVSVSYNRFGKVKRKTWLNADGTITERTYNT